MKIIIKNYKSIVNLEYKIENNIQYLIGKNESGKSNILDAILEISNDNIDEKNKNHNFPDEKIIISYSINNLKNKEIKKEVNIKSNKINFEWFKKEILEQKKYEKSILIKSLKNEKEQKECFENLNVLKTIENNLIIEKIFDDFSYKDKLYYFLYSNEKINLFIKNKLKFDIRKYALDKKINEYKEIRILINKEFSFLKEINEKTLEYSKQLCVVHKYKKDKLLKENYTFKEALESDSFLSLWQLLGHEKESIEILMKNDLYSNKSTDEREKIEKKVNIKLKSFSNDFWKTDSIYIKIKIHDKDFSIHASDIFDDKTKGKLRSLNKRSDGMKKYLSLLLFFETIKNKSKENEKIVVLLDEPGNFLHFTAILDLRKYIENFTKKNKNFYFIISTHNHNFIKIENLENVDLVIKESEKNGTNLVKKVAFENDKKKHQEYYLF